MCEQTEINYLEGEVVWVKLGSCWWPGEVVSPEKLPPDVLPSFRKPPIAIVKFFQEDTYEYVKNINSIYKYNCSRKSEFVNKGLYMYRSKHGHMEKFPEDIIRAETAVGGDIEILTREEFQEPRKKSYAGLFGDPKKMPASAKKGKGGRGRPPLDSPKVNSSPVRRLVKEKTDYKVHILVQGSKSQEPTTPPADVPPVESESQPSTSAVDPKPAEDVAPEEEKPPATPPSTPTSAGLYACPACPFTTQRLNVLILHNKTHSVSFIPYTHSPVRKATPKPSPAKSTPKSSKTPKPRQPRKEKAAKAPKDASSPPRKRAAEDLETEAKKLKTDEEIKSSLLADWDDDADEESNDESVATAAARSPEAPVPAESPAAPVPAGSPAAPVPTESPVPADSPAEPVPAESPAGAAPAEPVAEKPESSGDSKYDFCEDEDWPVEADAGRKIPRIMNPKRKDRKSLSLDDEEMAREVAELLNKTTVPELPSAPDPLKVEENFPEATIVKSPDKKPAAPDDNPPSAMPPTKAIFKTKTFFRSRHSRSQDAIGKYVAEQLSAVERMDIAESDTNGADPASPPAERARVARLAPKIQLKKMWEREKNSMERMADELDYSRIGDGANETNHFKPASKDTEIEKLQENSFSTFKLAQDVLYPTQEIKPVNIEVYEKRTSPKRKEDAKVKLLTEVFENVDKKIDLNSENVESVNALVTEEKKTIQLNEVNVSESTPGPIPQKTFVQHIDTYMNESTASAVDALLSVSRESDRVTKIVSNDLPEDLFEDDNRDSIINDDINGESSVNIRKENGNCHDQAKEVIPNDAPMPSIESYEVNNVVNQEVVNRENTENETIVTEVVDDKIIDHDNYVSNELSNNDTLVENEVSISDVPETVSVQEDCVPAGPEEEVENELAGPEKVVENMPPEPEKVVENALAGPEQVAGNMLDGPEQVAEKVLDDQDQVNENVLVATEQLVENVLDGPEQLVENVLDGGPQQVDENVLVGSEQVIENVLDGPEQVVGSMLVDQEQIVENMQASPEQVIESVLAGPEQVIESMIAGPEQVVESMQAGPEQVDESLLAGPEQVVDNVPTESDLQIAEALINLPATAIQNKTLINLPAAAIQNKALINLPATAIQNKTLINLPATAMHNKALINLPTAIPNKALNNLPATDLQNKALITPSATTIRNKALVNLPATAIQNNARPVDDVITDIVSYEEIVNDVGHINSSESLLIPSDELNNRFETEQEKSENLNAAQSLVQMSETIDRKLGSNLLETSGSAEPPYAAAEPGAAEPRVTEPRVTEPRVTEPRVTESRVTEPRAAPAGDYSTDCGTTKLDVPSKLLKILEEPYAPKVVINRSAAKQLIVPGKEKILNFDVAKAGLRGCPQSPKQKIIIRRAAAPAGKPSLINSVGDVAAPDKIVLSRSGAAHDGAVQTFTIQTTGGSPEPGALVIQQKVRKIAKTTKIQRIKPQNSLISPVNDSKPTRSDDVMFDINSMPIVLSEDLLTPESIERMPVVMSDAKPGAAPPLAPKVVKPKPTVLDADRPGAAAKPEQKTLLLAPAVDLGKVTTPNILSKSAKLRGAKPMLVIDKATGKQKIIMTKAEPAVREPKPAAAPPAVPALASGVKGEKFIILPTGGSPRAARPQKIVIDPATGKAHVFVARGEPPAEPRPAPPAPRLLPADAAPAGNTVMIITNAQGAQSRIVLTPEHEKILFPNKQPNVAQLKSLTQRISPAPRPAAAPPAARAPPRIVPKQRSAIITSKGQLIVGGRAAPVATSLPEIRPAPRRVVAAETRKLAQTVQKTSAEPLIFLQQKSGAVMQFTAAQFEHLQKTGQIVPRVAAPATDGKSAVPKAAADPLPVVTKARARRPPAESPTLAKRVKHEVAIAPAPSPAPVTITMPPLTPIAPAPPAPLASSSAPYAELENFEELLPSTAIVRAPEPTPPPPTAPAPSLADGQLLAVPGEHFGGPAGSFYLCVEDNGTLTPIDNRPLTLENDQLVPMATPPERRDILEAALANSDVFRADAARDDVPDFRDLNANVSVHCRVAETSATMHQPIMTPVELPPAAGAGPVVPADLDAGLAVIGVAPPHVPTSLELPITVTDPRLSVAPISMPLLTDEYEPPTMPLLADDRADDFDRT